MEGGPGTDFEVLMQEHHVLVDADPALSVMDRIARIGVDEVALGDELAGLRRGELLHRVRRGEDIREQKEAERDAEDRAEHAAKQKDRKPPPHGRLSSDAASVTLLRA